MPCGSVFSRRAFTAGLSSCALAAAAAPAWARTFAASDRIQVGIIGLGLRGNDLLNLVLEHRKSHTDVEIVALCDVYQKRLTAAVQKVPGARTYTRHQDLLQNPDIDAVFVATPDQWHAPIVLEAMARGKDVYVEKPMAHTLEEAIIVARRTKELNRVVQVGVQGLSWRRWHRIREAIESGMIGQVVAVQGTYSRNDPAGDWNWPIDAGAGPDATGDLHIDWDQWLGPAPKIPFNADRFFRFRKYWDYSGGIATDLHYHVVAPFHLAIANEFPIRVAGTGGLWSYHDGREVPDTFLTAADYPSKFSLMVQSSQVNENGPRTVIRGTRGTIYLSDEWEGPPSRQYSYADVVPDHPYAADFARQYGDEMVRIDNVGNDGDLLHVENFFNCIRTRQTPNCSVDIGCKVMAAIDLSVRSYRNGRMYSYDPEKNAVIEAIRG